MQVQLLTAAQVGLSREECGLSGSETRVVQVDTKAPGRRSCKFSDSKQITQMIREVCL